MFSPTNFTFEMFNLVNFTLEMFSSQCEGSVGDPILTSDEAY